MARFVLLRHESPPDSDRPAHWDFMLESGDALRTWSLTQPPRVGETVSAQALLDHRLAYLEYEGPVSGGRGEVARWDWGTYQIESEAPNALVLTLAGQRLSGRVTLARSEGEGGAWTLELAES
ncbi:MAG: DNA polymerase ligase N-terminal domain-containing protein [Pirellulales bacterium]